MVTLDLPPPPAAPRYTSDPPAHSSDLALSTSRHQILLASSPIAPVCTATSSHFITVASYPPSFSCQALSTQQPEGALGEKSGTQMAFRVLRFPPHPASPPLCTTAQVLCSCQSGALPSGWSPRSVVPLFEEPSGPLCI